MADKTRMESLDIRGREVPVYFTKNGVWIAVLPSSGEVRAKTRKELYVKLLQESRNDYKDEHGHWSGLFRSG